MRHTYPIGVIGQPTVAVQAAGARVAVHSTRPDAGQLVAAGSIRSSTESGWLKPPSRRGRPEEGLDAPIGALRALLNGGPTCPPAEPAGRPDRLAWLLPLAARHSIPVLVGIDVTAALPWEGVLLSQMGLDPRTRWRQPAPGPAGSSVPRPPPTASPTTTTTPATTPGQLNNPAAS
jgi:hypothetical protein